MASGEGVNNTGVPEEVVGLLVAFVVIFTVMVPLGVNALWAALITATVVPGGRVAIEVVGDLTGHGGL